MSRTQLALQARDALFIDPANTVNLETALDDSTAYTYHLHVPPVDFSVVFPRERGYEPALPRLVIARLDLDFSAARDITYCAEVRQRIFLSSSAPLPPAQTV